MITKEKGRSDNKEEDPPRINLSLNGEGGNNKKNTRIPIIRGGDNKEEDLSENQLQMKGKTNNKKGNSSEIDFV